MHKYIIDKLLLMAHFTRNSGSLKNGRVAQIDRTGGSNRTRLLRNKDIEIKSLYNIAYEYKKMNDFENTLIYIDKFFSICSINDNYNVYLRACILKGNCYNEIGKLDEAMGIYNDTLNLINDSENPLNCFLYDNLAEVYYKKGDVDMALAYYSKTQQFREKYDKEKLQKTLIDKAALCVKEKMYDEAQKLLKDGITLAIQHKDNEYMMRGYELLEEIYTENEDKEKLEEIYKKMLSLLNYINKAEAMKIYMKLSMLEGTNDNIDKGREYLVKAIKL
jgi:tetratricopeptide (TPR) repeat protein